LKETGVPTFIFPIIGFFAKNFYHYQNYTEEMEIVAEIADVPFGAVFLINFLYELTATSTSNEKSCTGVLVRDENGHIIHGRNLDFNFAPYVANLTVVIDHYDQNDNLIYSANAIIGTIFYHSGVRYGGFSINENTRNEYSIWQILDNLFIK